MRAGRKREQGYTYLALLLAVGIGGAVLASIGEVSSRTAQRDKEVELLFVGQEFRKAIAAYYERSPGGAKQYPRRLEDLLEDKRHPGVQRHLRRVYPDPLTGKADWVLVEAPAGGFMGVHSASDAAPLKTGAFAKADESFNDARRYSDWKFFYTPPASPEGLRAPQTRNTGK